MIVRVADIRQPPENQWIAPDRVRLSIWQLCDSPAPGRTVVLLANIDQHVARSARAAGPSDIARCYGYWHSALAS